MSSLYRRGTEFSLNEYLEIELKYIQIYSYGTFQGISAVFINVEKMALFILKNLCRKWFGHFFYIYL